MPKQATQELYTDIDPHGPLAGRGKVFTEASHPQAGYMLMGTGGVFSDSEVARLKLEDCAYLIDWDEAASLAENEARNRATYGKGAVRPGISIHRQKLPAPGLAEKYGAAIAGLLEKGGFATVAAVEAAADEDLLALHGIAQAKLETIRGA